MVCTEWPGKHQRLRDRLEGYGCSIGLEHLARPMKHVAACHASNIIMISGLI